jgi:hypothetical protein
MNPANALAAIIAALKDATADRRARVLTDRVRALDAAERERSSRRRSTRPAICARGAPAPYGEKATRTLERATVRPTLT